MFWLPMNGLCRMAAIAMLIAFMLVAAWPLSYSKDERQLAQSMLRGVAADVPKYYYDPKLRGVDWDAKVRETRDNIDKADSMDGAISEIASLLDSLDDSHTFFIPPSRTHGHKYGFRMRMIGDRCYITQVRSGSDADKKGLKPGDQIRSINGVTATRQNLPRMGYIVDTLRPLPQLRLSLLTIDGNERQVDVITEYRLSSIVKYGQHQGINQIVRDFTRERLLLRPRYVEVGDALIAVQFPEFDFSADEVDAILGKMRKHKAVIFDLRDNPGGFESTLQRLVGCLFQYDIKMFDRVGRDSTKPVSASGRHSDAFTGRFAVLIDSKSASASELFARIVQLQRRGFVIGDRSSGKVMEAQFYSHDLSIDWAALYGASITRADLLMSDGKTLEHVGVEPDILILPTAQDLAASRDPVLAKACKLLGTPISPEEAGKFFPYQEPTEE